MDTYTGGSTGDEYARRVAAQMEERTPRRVTWEARDIGHGVEKGETVGHWGATDWTGKTEITPTNGRESVYLFPDEIMSDEPATWWKDGAACPGGNGQDAAVASWESRYTDGTTVLDVEYVVMNDSPDEDYPFYVEEVDHEFRLGADGEIDSSSEEYTYEDAWPFGFETLDAALAKARQLADEDEAWKLQGASS